MLQNYNKYLKYKNKYLDLKGGILSDGQVNKLLMNKIPFKKIESLIDEEKEYSDLEVDNIIPSILHITIRVLRVPGSGIVKKVAIEKHEVYIENDLYPNLYDDEGNINMKLKSESEEWCKQQIVSAMEKNIKNIYQSNTNLVLSNIVEYLNLAREYDYKVDINLPNDLSIAREEQLKIIPDNILFEKNIKILSNIKEQLIYSNKEDDALSWIYQLQLFIKEGFEKYLEDGHAIIKSLIPLEKIKIKECDSVDSTDLVNIRIGFVPMIEDSTVKMLSKELDDAYPEQNILHISILAARVHKDNLHKINKIVSDSYELLTNTIIKKLNIENYDLHNVSLSGLQQMFTYIFYNPDDYQYFTLITRLFNIILIHNLIHHGYIYRDDEPSWVASSPVKDMFRTNIADYGIVQFGTNMHLHFTIHIQQNFKPISDKLLEMEKTIINKQEKFISIYSAIDVLPAEYIKETNIIGKVMI